MIGAVKGKLFGEQLSLYGRQYALEVYLMQYLNNTNFYRCILDDIKTLDLWIDDNGNWIDLQNGPSELCSKIGETIEDRLLSKNQTTITNPILNAKIYNNEPAN